MNTKSADDQNQLRKRLSRLGGKRAVQTGRARGASGERMGRPVDTPHGTAYVIEERFPLEHQQGRRALRELSSYDPRPRSRDRPR